MGSAEDDWRADGYRAIGRWMVEFSRLVGSMRTNMEGRLGNAREGDDLLIVPLAFAGATAIQIADSFFGMCRLAGHLDPVEENIANQLQKEVIAEIGIRNKIAHGDWIIGKGIEQGTAQTHLVRIHAKAPHRRVETYTGEDLDRLSDRLATLTRMTWTFGGLAFGHPLLTVSGQVQAGVYRVRDVLIAENVPQSGKGGQVVIGGPKAQEIL